MTQTRHKIVTHLTSASVSASALASRTSGLVNIRTSPFYVNLIVWLRHADPWTNYQPSVHTLEGKARDDTVVDHWTIQPSFLSSFGSYSGRFLLRPGERRRSTVMSISVRMCLSVCMLCCSSARISQEAHARSLPIFLWTVHMSLFVVRSSSGRG